MSCKITPRHAVKFSAAGDFDDLSKREQFLDEISKLVPPDRILAAMFQSGQLKVYLSSFADTKCLLTTGITFQGTHLPAQTLVSAYTVRNIPPTVQDNELRNLFGKYGGVVDIEKVPFCPSSSRFAHVVGSERRVFLETKQDLYTVVPSTLTFPYCGSIITFNVNSHCIICEMEDHQFSNCRTVKVKEEPESEDKCQVPVEGRESPILLDSDVFRLVPSLVIVNRGLEDGKENHLLNHTSNSNAFRHEADSGNGSESSDELPSLETGHASKRRRS